MSVSPSRARLLGALAAASVTLPLGAAAQSAPVRMGVVPTDSYAEPYYAQESGAFARAGLAVELSVFTNGSAMAQAVAGGALDLALADPIQVANALRHNLNFAILAPSYTYDTESSTTDLCVQKNSPVRGPKDLEGKTVGVNALKSVTELATREWIRQGGADPNKVQFVELGISAVVPGILRGTVTAAVVSEPNLSSALGDVAVLAKTFDGVANGKPFYLNTFFGRREWLAADRDRSKKLAAAIYEAARWANTHRAETAPILAKYAKIDLERLHAMARATYATSLDPKLLQPVLDLGLRYGALDVAANAQDLIFS